MNQNEIDDIKGQIILEELAAKQELERIATETAAQYYTDTWPKAIRNVILIVIYTFICVENNLSAETSVFMALMFAMVNESTRQSKKIDALAKLYEMSKSK